MDPYSDLFLAPWIYDASLRCYRPRRPVASRRIRRELARLARRSYQ